MSAGLEDLVETRRASSENVQSKALYRASIRHLCCYYCVAAAHHQGFRMPPPMALIARKDNISDGHDRGCAFTSLHVCVFEGNLHTRQMQMYKVNEFTGILLVLLEAMAVESSALLELFGSRPALDNHHKHLRKQTKICTFRFEFNVGEQYWPFLFILKLSSYLILGHSGPSGANKPNPPKCAQRSQCTQWTQWTK